MCEVCQSKDPRYKAAVEQLAKAGLQWQREHKWAAPVYSWNYPKDQEVSLPIHVAIGQRLVQCDKSGYDVLKVMVDAMALHAGPTAVPSVIMVKLALEMMRNHKDLLDIPVIKAKEQRPWDEHVN